MANKIVQKNTRTTVNKTNQPLVKTEEKKVIQKLKRELPKIPSFSSPALLNKINLFTASKNDNYYLGFGGLGDAILLLASCWDDPKAKVVFFANQRPFIQEFFTLFGINSFIHDNVMGTVIANHVYDYMIKLPGFKTSAHLADGLDYNDWKNEDKYIQRIKPKADWVRKFGVSRRDTPTIIVAPSGSHKSVGRQRYLTPDEYKKLCNKYLNKGYTVYGSGSMNDLHYFKLIDHKNFYWLNSESIYQGNGKGEPSNLKRMLQIINGADLILSMDTWMKTYTLLCQLPTIVIKTRWNNSYKKYGDDITDYIFLNKRLWPSIKFMTIEELHAL